MKTSAASFLEYFPHEVSLESPPQQNEPTCFICLMGVMQFKPGVVFRVVQQGADYYK